MILYSVSYILPTNFLDVFGNDTNKVLGVKVK
jgi:hypothetical protein